MRFMNYLTEEKFEQEIEVLRLREFEAFKEEMTAHKLEMLGFKSLMEYLVWKNDQEHLELKGMISGVQTTVDKVYNLLDRDTHKMEEIDRDVVTIHARVDRVERYLGPGFEQVLASE